jgi:short-subunit dehydrogenase
MTSKTLFLVGMGPGVGAAVARRFAAEGFAVGAIARSAAALDATLPAVAALGVPTARAQADAGDSTALQAALAALQAQLGAPGVLVYNAAAVTQQPLADLAPERLAADLGVSVVGALAATQAVLPAMRAQGQGTLLYTGGGFAFEPMPVLATLGAGKAALRNLAFSLHAALAPEGLHAATVTIGGMVQAGGPFDPERIAEHYWALHAQPRAEWQRERVISG